MRAALLRESGPVETRPLAVEELPKPEPGPGEVLLRVRACGVCRTDLHIVEGELPAHRRPLVPGHQIVGTVEACGADVALEHGARRGVSWLASVYGTCAFCRRGDENICDTPRFTGYDVDGGYAEFALARADFTYPLPDEFDDVHAAPLLCAGIIGFRALRVAGVRPGERVGLFGFGASAHLALPVLESWGCYVAAATRSESHQQFARENGADWAGGVHDVPAASLDRAVTFAPAGEVVVAALRSLRKGGVVAINAIHLDCMPEFDYDSLLWGERQIRSVANMTRADARDFLELAAMIGMKPTATVFPLDHLNDALDAVKSDAVQGAAVVTIGSSAR